MASSESMVFRGGLAVVGGDLGHQPTVRLELCLLMQVQRHLKLTADQRLLPKRLAVLTHGREQQGNDVAGVVRCNPYANDGKCR